MKQRAAICFSGMPRNFKTVFPLFEKYIVDILGHRNVTCDIFVHTWDNKVQYAKYLKDEGSANECIDMYSPVSYKIETYDVEKIKFLERDSGIDKYLTEILSDYNRRDNDIADWIGGGTLRNNTISLFYGMNQVNNLRIQYEQSNNFVYDIIIKNRFDNLIYNNLMTLPILANTIYSPYGYEPDTRDKLGTINDIFAIGDRNGMNTYLSLYNNLYNLVTDRYLNKHPRPWHTIGLVKHNLVVNNIDIKRFYLDHIVSRRLHKYKEYGSVVTGENWNIKIPYTENINSESKIIGY